MKEAVLQYIEEQRLIGAKDRVLLGCSGGADSMCLLHLLSSLQKDLDFELFAVHVHHHLRGEDADLDAAFTEDACRTLGVPFLLIHKDAAKRKEEQKLSTEEAARSCRYEAFEEAAAQFGTNKLALAHHTEDRAETMLFQMIRGSGLRGSAGMQPKRVLSDMTLIRPLLSVSKEAILQYNAENGITWREDATNQEDDASRNLIRHEVLPALCRIRPDAVEKLNALGAYFSDVDGYLRREASAWIAVYMRNTPSEIPEDPFRDTPKILQEYIVAALLRQHEVPMKDKGRTHLDAVAGLIGSEVGKRIPVSSALQAVRTYTGIRFENALPKKEDADGERPGHTMETRVFSREKGAEIPQKEYTKWFDYDKIKGPLELRTRAPHDVFSQAAGAHKKLKDFFIDEKIPQKERDSILVVADGSEILWVVGVRMSEAFKVTEDTKRIIEITIRREEN